MSGKKGEIKCGGGLLLLSDGTFTFFVELHIQGSIFNFESLDTWKLEAEAESQMTLCIAAFPNVIAKAASTKDFDLVDVYTAKWNLIKILPNKEEGDVIPDGSPSVH